MFYESWAFWFLLGCVVGGCLALATIVYRGRRAGKTKDFQRGDIKYGRKHM